MVRVKPSQPSLWFQQLLAGDEDASPVLLNVAYSDVLYTYSTDLEGYLSSASQVIDDINDKSCRKRSNTIF